MGIKEAFQKGAKSVITAFDNAVDTCEYSRKSQSYESTSNVISVNENSYPGIPIIFDSFTADEINKYNSQGQENVLVTDVKGLIAGLDLPVDLPKSGDTITKADGTDYTLKNFWKTPADALYTLQLRRV